MLTYISGTFDVTWQLIIRSGIFQEFLKIGEVDRRWRVKCIVAVQIVIPRAKFILGL